ncbi:MarR family transcriptional regulator, partial [Microbacteriaceae bacterium K1510]|nr:MarR family transcriptional regulator [Microbacteriaceae bacterium K1510]
MTTIHDQKLSKYGLTTSQVSVLAQLWQNDGQSQKDLVAILGVRPASLTGVVDGLVAKGWVERKSIDQDARIKRLFLTPAGKALE